MDKKPIRWVPVAKTTDDMNSAKRRVQPDRQPYSGDVEHQDVHHHHHIHLGGSGGGGGSIQDYGGSSKSGTVLYGYDQTVYAAPTVTGCLKCWIGFVLCPLATLCCLFLLLLVGVKWARFASPYGEIKKVNPGVRCVCSSPLFVEIKKALLSPQNNFSMTLSGLASSELFIPSSLCVNFNNHHLHVSICVSNSNADPKVDVWASDTQLGFLLSFSVCSGPSLSFVLPSSA